VDRLHVPDDGDVFSVLDYKAQRKGDLDKLLSQRDDVQLSCYALLREDVEQFGFVAVDDEVTLVEPARAPAAAAEAERERIASVFSAVRAGAPLVAIGDTVACTYCEMGGLCRRQHWEGA
jgi:ATP-dependent helicase/nuclease subunit B